MKNVMKKKHGEKNAKNETQRHAASLVIKLKIYLSTHTHRHTHTHTHTHLGQSSSVYSQVRYSHSMEAGVCIKLTNK